MTMIDIKMNPSRRDLLVFAVVLVLFTAVLAALSLFKPEALLGAAIFTFVTWLLSMTFNNEIPRKLQLLGLIIPLVLFTISRGKPLGVEPNIIAGVIVVVGLIGATLTGLSRTIGRKLYVGWMYAALPIGWTISHVVLMIVFYLVITPIALVMRLAGRDALSRRFEPNAKTYWLKHESATDKGRYFRQF